MPTPVPGYGPLDARIVLCGEAPGHEEELQGRPFVGSSGKLLNAMLAQAGIARESCYITNVVKVRPPNNDFGVFYDDPRRRVPKEFLTNSWGSLREEIQRIKPNVTIALGAEALRALTGRTGIDSWRGSILSSPVGKLIPTFHPARILRVYSEKCIAELDLRRAGEESLTSTIRPLGLSFELSPSASRIIEFINSVLERARREPTRVAFDIETTGHLCRCIALADTPTHAMCIPFISGRSGLDTSVPGRIILDVDHSEELNSHYSLEEEYEILRALDRLFRDEEVEKVAQNFPFDTTVLAREFGFEVRALTMDTMVAHHALYPELPKGLDFLTSIYTRIPYYSSYDASVDHETWTYNCYDAVATYRVAGALDRELAEAGLEEFYRNHLHPTLFALTRTQNRGVVINQVLRQEMSEKNNRELEEIGTRLKALTGEEFNPRSWKQKSELFYHRLGMPIQYKPGKERKQTTDKNAIAQLIKKYPQHAPTLQLILDYQERATLKSTFLEKELDHEGRIRTSYNLTGAITGRLSSSEPLWEPGTNLQNIPIRTETGRLFRRLFQADPLFSLIKADLSQAEFRIVCWLARIGRIIRRYSEDAGFDVHRWVASLLFTKPEPEIIKTERDTAKVAVHGGNYEIGPAKLAYTNKNVTFAQADWALKRYRELVPEIPLWWEEVKRNLNATRTIQSPIGRRRLFLDRLDDELYRAAYSHSAQSIVADIINRAWTLSVETFNEAECYPCLQVHDELVFQCRTELVAGYARRIRTLMEYPLVFPGVEQPLVIPADISWGPNWLDQTKI